MGQESGVAVGCGVGCRHSSDPALLWLWGRLAATAPIGPLAWQPLYAAGEALKRQRDQKKKKRGGKEKKILDIESKNYTQLESRENLKSGIEELFKDIIHKTFLKCIYICIYNLRIKNSH